MDFHDLEQVFGVPAEAITDMLSNILGPNATQEEMETAIADIMANFEKMVSQAYSLKDCLSFLTKEDLIELMKTLKCSGYSKMRKDELVIHLEHVLAAPEYTERIYPDLGNGEIEILKQLCIVNTPLISTDIMFSAADLIRYGLCYLDEYGKHLVMPEEIKQNFLAAQANAALQVKQKNNVAVYNACHAAVYFYGVYPITDLCDRIQETSKQAFTEDTLVAWHAHAALHREEFFFKNGYIISTALYQTPEDVVALQQIQKMKKRFFWPEPAVLDMLAMELWVIDDRLYEPFWDFAPLLMENEFGDVMSVSRFVEASIRTGAPFDSLMGFLSERVFAFESFEQIDAFTQVMQNLWDNTPMWENCGYSLNQLKALLQKPSAAKKESSGKVVSLAEHRAKKNK